MAKQTALAKIEPVNFPMVDAGEISQMFQEEFDGLDLKLDFVKIPSGGGLAFQIPTGEERPEIAQDLDVVIVDNHSCNAYWPGAEMNKPPVCSSMDSRVGVGDPGGECKECPFNQYGSAFDPATGEKKKGKACKNMRRLYIVREGEFLPHILSLPPSSLNPYSDYLKRLLLKGLRPWQVVTRISLKAAKSSGNIEYSEAVFSLVGKLDEASLASIVSMRPSVQAMARRVEIASDDYNAPTAGAHGNDPSDGVPAPGDEEAPY